MNISAVAVRNWFVASPRRTVLLATAAVLALAFYMGDLNGDIARLYDDRGIRPSDLPYIDRPLEYPVGVGAAMWFGSLLSFSAWSFYLVTVAAEAALALWLSRMLADAFGFRALLWALSPALAVYAFHNWDMFVVAPAVAGLFAFERRHYGAAGALLGLATWVKLYPGLFVVALVVILVARRRKHEAFVLGAAAAGVSVVVNAIVVLSPSGWWYPVSFQGERLPTWGSLWQHVFTLPGLDHVDSDSVRSIVNVGSAAVIALGLVLIIYIALRRNLNAFATAGALTALFLLVNKVYSPQYSLWLIPFFVVLPVSVKLWAAFSAADLAIYAVVFMVIHDVMTSESVETLMSVLVTVRALVLLAFLVVSLRRNVPDSQPTPGPVRRDDEGFLDEAARAVGAP